jgi:penicillin-binding protein 1A
MRAGAGAERVILEAFKPGTAPPDSYSVVGFTDSEGRSYGGNSGGDSNQFIRSGTGGLY